MTVLTNSYLTFSAVGNREDLSDKITNIDSVECPIQDAIGTTAATAANHEWQSQALAAAAANAQLEAENITSYGAVTPTTRLNNRCQISFKPISIGDRQNIVDKAGRKKEMVYQLMLKNKELRRDMEFVLSNNQAPVTGNSTTAPQLRPLNSWYPAGNSDRGAGGSAGSSSTAATDGTQRAVAETMLQGVLTNVWSNGGKGDLIVTGGTQKRNVSAFTGNQTRMGSPDGKKLYTSFSVYVDDFGDHKIVADRFTRNREIHVLTTDLLALAYIQKPYTKDLATTGLAQNAVVVADWTLEVGQPNGIGIVADLT